MRCACRVRAVDMQCTRSACSAHSLAGREGPRTVEARPRDGGGGGMPARRRAVAGWWFERRGGTLEPVMEHDHLFPGPAEGGRGGGGSSILAIALSGAPFGPRSHSHLSPLTRPSPRQVVVRLHGALLGLGPRDRCGAPAWSKRPLPPPPSAGPELGPCASSGRCFLRAVLPQGGSPSGRRPWRLHSQLSQRERPGHRTQRHRHHGRRLPCLCPPRRSLAHWPSLLEARSTSTYSPRTWRQPWASPSWSSG